MGAEYPGVLRAANALELDVVWRQRVTAYWGEGESHGFDAVVQRFGDTLTILGMSPTGAVGFSIVLEDGEVALTNNMPDELPFPPRNVLLDVQRAFYPWLASGQLAGQVDGEAITEVWTDGKLTRRTFVRLDGQPKGGLNIRYQWGPEDWAIPAITHFDNGWFGYRLEIETQAETLIEGEAP
ncbi:MAG: hypothetical protein ACI8QC_002616 [Planctomycetota bacterium]|jgi:hypothetical protein